MIYKKLKFNALIICLCLFCSCLELPKFFSKQGKKIEQENVERGMAYYKNNAYDEALYEFNQALKKNPESVRALFQSGVIYHKRGQFDLALKNYLDTVRLDPGHSKAIFNLALFYSEDRLDYEKAIGYFNDFLKANPNYSDKARIEERIGELRDKLDQQNRDRVREEHKKAMLDLTEALTESRAQSHFVGIDEVTPLVVCIWGYIGNEKLRCSGLIINKDGYVITIGSNWLPKCEVIIVTTAENSSLKARLIQADMISDLCILKVDEEFNNVKIFDAQDSKIGEETKIIECFSGLEHKFIKGNLAAMPDSSANIPYFHIKLTGDLNSVNSGSPVFNKSGNLLGLFAVYKNVEPSMVLSVRKIREILSIYLPRR